MNTQNGKDLLKKIYDYEDVIIEWNKRTPQMTKGEDVNEYINRLNAWVMELPRLINDLTSLIVKYCEDKISVDSEQQDSGDSPKVYLDNRLHGPEKEH